MKNLYIVGLVLSMIFLIGANIPRQKIAVIDMNKIMLEYKASKDYKQKVEKVYDSDQSKIRELIAEIKKLEESLVVLGDKKKNEVEKKLSKLRKEFIFRKERVNMLAMNEHENSSFKIYQDVVHEVKLYAKKHGFNIVLRKSEENSKLNDRENKMSIASNLVLFNDAESDITDQIITMLNLKYENKLLRD